MPQRTRTHSRTCSVEGCGTAAIKRGMCNRHYLRWYRSTPREQRTPTWRDLDDEARFWEKVERKGPSGCWPWHGCRRPSGHGVAVVGGKSIPAGAAALIFSGKPRHDGMWALHRCDNPECVNPRHLYWGTPQDNSDDAWARGLHPVRNSKVTADQVVEIRDMYAAGADASDLAMKFGIAKCSIYLITSGAKWKNVGGPITHHRTSRKAA